MYKYRLENGLYINSERIVDAVLQETDFPQLYLDSELGNLIEIFSRKSLGAWVEEIGNMDRYYLIERYTPEERTQYAHGFVDGIMQINLKSEELSKAHRAIDAGGWIAFDEFLMEETDGWIEGWRQYQSDTAWEYVHEWLCKNPHVVITAEHDSCQGCSICEAMKNGNTNTQDIQKAFETESIMQQVQLQVASYKKENQTLPKKFLNEALVLKVSLNYSKPKIWRRIVVPATYTFFELHSAIIDAMGWADGHLHSFQIDQRGKPSATKQTSAENIIHIQLPDPEFPVFGAGTPMKDERHEYLCNWFGKKCKQCVYTYDFGDNWDHTVLLEKMIPISSENSYPQCTGGKNACPPEDCGGIWGYEHVKKVLGTPSHAEYAHILAWLGLEKGTDFDPSHFSSKDVIFSNPSQKLAK